MLCTAMVQSVFGILDCCKSDLDDTAPPTLKGPAHESRPARKGDKALHGAKSCEVVTDPDAAGKVRVKWTYATDGSVEESVRYLSPVFKTGTGTRQLPCDF
eukprot:SAG31_NODE_1699_length_7499_cov_5.315135_11_plen_101_part_00